MKKAMGTRPIAPVGSKILDHPKFNLWLQQGYAVQKDNGLWLHYSVVCELLRKV
jgi:hypothetical protein